MRASLKQLGGFTVRAFQKQNLPLTPVIELDRNTGELTFTARDEEALKKAEMFFTGENMGFPKVSVTADPETMQIVVKDPAAEDGYNHGMLSNEMLSFLARLKVGGNGYIDMEQALKSEDMGAVETQLRAHVRTCVGLPEHPKWFYGQ